jgi:hypothetical protein
MTQGKGVNEAFKKNLLEVSNLLSISGGPLPGIEASKKKSFRGHIWCILVHLEVGLSHIE